MPCCADEYSQEAVQALVEDIPKLAEELNGIIALYELFLHGQKIPYEFPPGKTPKLVGIVLSNYHHPTQNGPWNRDTRRQGSIISQAFPFQGERSYRSAE